MSWARRATTKTTTTTTKVMQLLFNTALQSRSENGSLWQRPLTNRTYIIYNRTAPNSFALNSLSFIKSIFPKRFSILFKPYIGPFYWAQHRRWCQSICKNSQVQIIRILFLFDISSRHQTSQRGGDGLPTPQFDILVLDSIQTNYNAHDARYTANQKV